MPADDERRAGWKCWGISDGQLRPLAGLAKPVSARANVVEAVCPHRNEIPSRRCPCGIHYVPRLGYFMMWMRVASPNLAREPYAISYARVQTERRSIRWKVLPSGLPPGH